MGLNGKRTAGLERLSSKVPMAEGMRYGSAKGSSLSAVKSMPMYEPPPRPKISAEDMAKEFESLAKKAEKMCSDWNDLWEEISLAHDRMYSVEAKTDDIPGRPVIGSEGYGSGNDIKNDLTTVAGWLRLTAVKVREAPKIETSKKK